MKDFSSEVINWHKQSGRKNLPWQLNKTPYKVWVSEIMLQQTRVITVIPYFKRFIKQFPNVSALARAELDDVLTLWSGLGYYSRARNLHKTANILKNDYDCGLPSSINELMTLPGIGRSTAGAIVSLGFNKRACILDGNVKRIVARYKNIREDITKSSTLNTLWSISEDLLPKKDFSTFNQSLMDLGSIICKRNEPLCNLCPVSKTCMANLNNTVHLVPFKAKQKRKPLKKVFWLLPFSDSGHIYLIKRPPYGIWGGLWSFLEYEDLRELIKESKSIFKITEDSLSKETSLKHSFSHYNLEAEVYLVNVKSQRCKKQWKKLKDLDNLGMPRPIINVLSSLKIDEKKSIL